MRGIFLAALAFGASCFFIGFGEAHGKPIGWLWLCLGYACLGAYTELVRKPGKLP